MLSFIRRKPSRPFIVLPIAFFVFFAMLFADSAESAAQKNAAKTKATPASNNKKTAKSAPTPNKKTQAKAVPTPKKTTDKKSTDKKGKDNSASKNQAQNASKNKASDKNKQTSSKTNQKNSDRKTDDSKRSANNKRDEKNKKTENSKNNRAENKSSDKTNSKTAITRNSDRKENVKKSERKTPPTRNTDRTTTSNAKTTTRTQPETMPELPQIIVTDVAARVRSQAQANAPELSRVKLGTVLKVTEKNPAWYRVQYTAAGGKTANGWISANSVNDLNSGAREELYRQIVDRNYRAEMDFAAASEMVEFLTEISGELGNTNASAELELKRLLALKTALKKIPSGQGDRSPYREFLRTHEKSVIYSDPAAEWYVVSNLFWDLHRKYSRTTLADQIAWEAATNNLPGECEGYVNCYIFSERMTNGEYLRLHPNGKKSFEALANMTRALGIIAEDLGRQTSYSGPSDVTDRAEFNNLLAELRTIVSRLPFTEKEKTLQQLKQIAEGFR